MEQHLESRKHSIMLDEMFNDGRSRSYDILEKHQLVKRYILGVRYDVVDMSSVVELQNSGHQHRPEHRRQTAKYRFVTCKIHFEGQGYVNEFQIPMYGGELGKLERDVELAYEEWMKRKKEIYGTKFDPTFDDPFIAIQRSKKYHT